MDFEKARFNMVEQQIRPWNVLDPAVLDLLFEVKREDFVPDAYRAIAFTDLEIPLGHGQSMMAPRLEARLLQELAPKPHERALEIGTGSGYFTALLARRAAHVTSIELYEDLWHRAATNLERAGIRNIQLKVGDAARSPFPTIGATERFDLIVLGGSVPEMPAAYLNLLYPGGRAIAVVGEAPAMKAMLFTCTGEGQFASRERFETVLAPLLNAAPVSNFSL
ncbi:MAG TPA: protein-L-isoaspartate O-methyltransferase [Usitatibacteraceae bacterium]|nr:protein-L-isoaspartate O-methyltransferase [Usitatibacteraceae bacterium]